MMQNTAAILLAMTAFAASACAQHKHDEHEGHAAEHGSATKSSAVEVVNPAASPHGGTLQQLDAMQVETVVAPGGLRLFAYDNQGQPLDLRNAKGLVALQIAGEAKKYRYDLFAEVGQDKSAGSLAVAVDLSRVGGRQVELEYQIVGLPGSGQRPAKFAVSAKVPMTEAQQVAAAIKAQGVCPVSGQPLGGMGKPVAVTIGDETIYVCCAGCIDEVKSNPAKYVAKKPKLVVTTATEADVAAIARQKVCPVMDEPLDAMGGPYKTVVDGRVIYLCCPGCAKKLHATSAVYLEKLAAQGITPPMIK